MQRCYRGEADLARAPSDAGDLVMIVVKIGRVFVVVRDRPVIVRV